MAKIDEPFLAWDFTLRDVRGKEMASVSRAFRGFGREVCTETSRLVPELIRSVQLFTDTGMTLPGLSGALVHNLVIQGVTLSGSRRQNDR